MRVWRPRPAPSPTETSTYLDQVPVRKDSHTAPFWPLSERPGGTSTGMTLASWWGEQLRGPLQGYLETEVVTCVTQLLSPVPVSPLVALFSRAASVR